MSDAAWDKAAHQGQLHAKLALERGLGLWELERNLSHGISNAQLNSQCPGAVDSLPKGTHASGPRAARIAIRLST